MRLYFKHTFNPLHVYCRLRSVGIAKPAARKFCSIYERYLFNLVTGRP